MSEILLKLISELGPFHLHLFTLILFSFIVVNQFIEEHANHTNIQYV